MILEEGVSMQPKSEKIFSQHLTQEIMVAVGVMVVVMGLALGLEMPKEQLVDPTDNSYVPRPEWYFLFLFQLLKLFPGKLELVAIVVVPLAGLILLFGLPFYDRNVVRHPKQRPLASGAGVLLLAAVIALTAWGADLPKVMAKTIGWNKAAIAAGKDIFDRQQCLMCHAINGQGQNIGPDLAGLGKRYDEAYVNRVLQNPQQVYPTTPMPAQKLSPKETESLIAYLMSLE